MSKPTEEQVDAEVDRALKSSNMYLRGIYMLVSSGIVFAFLGAISGWVFALAMPGYFRNVYDATDSDLWQVAIGLGLARGFWLGILLSSVVLLATAWYRSRIRQAIMDQYEKQSQ